MMNILKLKKVLTFCILMLGVAIFTTGFTSCSVAIGKLVEYRSTYCDKTTDSLAKDVAIAAIHTKLPGYPKEGICTRIGLEEFKDIDNSSGEAFSQFYQYNKTKKGY